MENHKISKLLDNSTASKFLTTKFIDINDLLTGQYSVNKNIRFKTPTLRSDLCDYSNAYIVVKGTVYLLASAANENNKVEKDIVLKNNAPFKSCISKIKNTVIDNAKDLNIVMPMYDLLEYSENCSMTSGRLWNYYSNKIDDADVNDNASDGKSF